MGTTSNFLLFTSAGAVTNTGTASIYAGNIGTNSGSISGFATLQTQPFGLFAQTPETAQCASDLALLYNDLLARPANLETTGVYGGILTTLTQGVYHSATAASIAGNLTFDAQNDPNARFIIQTDGAFTMAAGAKIILANGAKAQNIFWVINGAASLAANAEAKGIFICSGAISLGASCKLEGILLTTVGAISGTEGMTLTSPFMLLKPNQTIYSGTMPSDLVLTGNSNPIVKWESSTDSNFTNPVDINYYSSTLEGSCIGPLYSTTYYRVVVLIDGVNVYSNTIKINVIDSPSIPDMGATGPFVLFTKTGDVTNTGTSTYNELIGTNAGNITGFVNTSILHTLDTLTANAAGYLQELFDTLSNISNTDNHIAAFGAGETLVPGAYFIGSAATMGGTLTLDGKGSSNSVFIIKIKGAFSFAASTKIILTNGATSSNIFWIIDGGLDVGASSEPKGNFICLAGAIALGNNCITQGRFLTLTGAITLQNCTLLPSIVASSNQVIRSGSQPQDLTLVSNVDTVVKWEKSSSFNFSNPTDIPYSNTTTLSSTQMGALTTTTYFRAVVQTGSTSLNSNIVTISINQATIPGLISSNQEYCSANQPTDLILLGYSGLIIKWQSALDSDFTTPTDILNTTNTLTGTDMGIVHTTTFYRAVVQNCTCPIEYAIPAKISIATLTTWNGTSWSNGPPSSSKSVIYAANYTANENIDACSITINNSAAVVINSGFTMTITNELTISGGFLTFENDASLVQINETAINSGNITYKRESASVRPSDYSYWSSPVADQTLAAAFPTSPANRIYSYDAFSTPEDWRREATSTIMSTGAGYIVQGPQTSGSSPPGSYETSFYGKSNNGVIELPIGSEDTSNLIGNPYPSAIDANMFLAANSTRLDGTIYFWTHASAIQLASEISNPGSGTYAYTANDYASYNSSGGVAANSGGIEPSGKIAAGQAFFTTSKTSNAKALFNNTMRIPGGNLGVDNSQFFKTNTTNTKHSTPFKKDRIWLNLSNSQGAFKQTLIGYVTGATNGYNDSYDGESFDGNEYVDFYSINSNKNLVIQGRAFPFDTNDEVPLGFRTTINGDFKISIDHVDGSLIGQDVFLKDNLNNTIFNLKYGDYLFSTAAGTFNSRFVLSYTNKSLETTDFSTQPTTVLVSTKNLQLSIISSVETIDKVFIYDVSGRQIYQKTNINDTELSIPDLVSSHQIVFVKTILQNKEVVSTKILY